MKKISAFYLFTMLFMVTLASYASTPLNQPNATDFDIKAWANEAFMAAYSYDFVNYAKEQTQASRYFFPAAWKLFQADLQKSGMIEYIKEQRLISTGLAERAGPVIQAQGIINGSYAWKVTFPATITFLSANTTTVKHVQVQMMITRTEQGVRGLAISSIKVTSVESNELTR